jgi:hypothetical protein
MSRHENEELDFQTPKPVVTEVMYFTEGGDSVEKDGSKSYAKRVNKTNVGTEDNAKSTTYYVKFGRGRIFDPWGTYADRTRTGDWDWRKVGPSVFEQYYKYLKTRSTRHLTQAERMIIDGNQK